MQYVQWHPNTLAAHAANAVIGLSPSQARGRIDALGAGGSLELDRETEPGHVHVRITEKGLAALAEDRKKINIPLLQAVANHDGAMASVIIEPFLKLHHESGVRAQLDKLAAAGYIELDRRSVRGRVFVRITEAGRRALEEAGQ
jgi:DNA-binding PadR family transcriptional regulator